MLKNILSLLLSKFYSKKDAAEIAALALPNHSDGIAISITEGANTYIAPADGYINFITARNGGVNVYKQTAIRPLIARPKLLFLYLRAKK